jgi:uncharacterized membrane protein YkoI
MTLLERGRFAVVALAALAAGVPLAGMAGEDHAVARRLREAGEIRSLEDISARARAAKAGEILETELERAEGRYVYEMEILDAQGQVWELKLDAKTGELLRMEIDD